jgi:UDP-N-acetylmuramoyl-L-alanyl-D-glutamate--2,6-diaminopimelate ligase
LDSAMKLNELLPELGPCTVTGRRDIEVTGITFDSRMVRPGYLFAALPGGRADGHDFVTEAIERGAVAILSQRDVATSNRATSLRVEDSRSALARVADCFYGSPSKEIEIIGVTGTNGKTTVCYLLRAMLKEAGRRPALLGTIEYLIGGRSIPAERTTPEAPYLQAMIRDAVREGCDCLVMEVSSHALEQQRVGGVAFDVAVFTNLGSDHLDFHGSIEEYFNAKAPLFTTPGLKRAVVNSDDPWGQKLAAAIAAPILTYGMGERAMVRALSIESGPGGSRLDIEAEHHKLGVTLPLLGRHNVYNALAAVGAALSVGIAPEAIISALSGAKPARGRLEEVPCARPYRVFIDYAHTEEALESTLLAVREGARGRIILVFGCGGDRDKSKRLPMGRAAARLADLSIVTTDNPRRENPLEIIAEISRGFSGTGKRCVQIPDRREAIAAALAEAREGDIVVVAGKGHERTQEFESTVVPFSDRDVITELAGQG